MIFKKKECIASAVVSRNVTLGLVIVQWKALILYMYQHYCSTIKISANIPLIYLTWHLQPIVYYAPTNGVTMQTTVILYLRWICLSEASDRDLSSIFLLYCIKYCNFAMSFPSFAINTFDTPPRYYYY